MKAMVLEMRDTYIALNTHRTAIERRGERKMVYFQGYNVLILKAQYKIALVMHV